MGTEVEELHELQVARHIFRSLDSNGEGRIRLNEDLVSRLTDEGIEVPDDVELIFYICDCNGSGSLQLTELVAILLGESLCTKKLCGEAFKLFDKNLDGRIDALDMLTTLNWYRSQCEDVLRE